MILPAAEQGGSRLSVSDKGSRSSTKAYRVVECGTALVPEVVIGHMQGGFAMGVGYALLENLPPYEDGPGNGKRNLGQYVVARVRRARGLARGGDPAAAYADGPAQGHGRSDHDPGAVCPATLAQVGPSPDAAFRARIDPATY